MADIKLKSLLSEGYWSGGFKGSGRTWHPSKEDTEKQKGILSKIASMFTGDYKKERE